MSRLSLFLDSGAFSLLTQVSKKKSTEDFIDSSEYKQFRDAYIRFILKYPELFNYYSNLDVIGDAQKTWENQQYLESFGLKPIPVFHYGSDVKWLLHYLNLGYDYIALGGMVPVSTAALIPWLDNLWANYLTDKDGYPIIKVHGFGMTSLKPMIRYPWFSVDSTSWAIYSKYGIVLVPPFISGEYKYDRQFRSVFVSTKSPKTRIEGKHITTFSGVEREHILNYFSSKGYGMGESEILTVDSTYKPLPEKKETWYDRKLGLVEKVIKPGLSNDYKLRDEINAKYFLDLEKNSKPWPWPFKLGKSINFMRGK
jgi:hypothetical protein